MNETTAQYSRRDYVCPPVAALPEFADMATVDILDRLGPIQLEFVHYARINGDDVLHRELERIIKAHLVIFDERGWVGYPRQIVPPIFASDIEAIAFAIFAYCVANDEYHDFTFQPKFFLGASIATADAH